MSEIDLIETPRRSPVLYLVIALVVVVVVLAVGSIGHFGGAGWFGYRQIMYGTGELYVLNMSDEQRFVSVDGRSPAMILPQNAQMAELIGGTSKIEILNEDKSLYETHEITTESSHVLLNLTPEVCLVVSDISSFYSSKNKGLEFVDKLRGDEQLYVTKSRNVVWPRRTFPARWDQALGPMLWIEMVGCPLLDDQEFLEGYLLVRLQQRMEARGQ